MIKLLKISFGAAFSIMLANFLGLNNASSAGIIAILTIQDTKKETIYLSIKRLFVFILATVLAVVMFEIFGYNPIVFGVFLFVYALLCYKIEFKQALSVIPVLILHYMNEQGVSVSLFKNELLLFLSGAGTGTLLNMYMPGDVKRIRKIQSMLEDDLRTILYKMSHYITEEDKSDYTGECFEKIDEHIKNGLKYAYANMNNTFMQETQYFIDYMQMRKQQTRILRNIYDKIITLESVPEQAQPIAEFIGHISRTFAESNNAKTLISECNTLCESFHNSPLPLTRSEFEIRAVLYLILLDFRTLIKIKSDFADSLSEKQIEIYWKNK